MIQLNPPLPLTTPKGKGLAHFVTDYSIEHHLYWTVFLDNGEIWTFANTEVRADSNETWGRNTEKECEHEWRSFPDNIYTFCWKCGEREIRTPEMSIRSIQESCEHRWVNCDILHPEVQKCSLCNLLRNTPLDMETY